MISIKVPVQYKTRIAFFEAKKERLALGQQMI